MYDWGNSDRKIHTKPIPNIGGIALFSGFWITTAVFVKLNQVQGEFVHYLWGLFYGSTLLFLTGLIDDRRPLSPIIKLGIHIVSALCLIAAGVGITFTQNPLGGIITLDSIKIPLSLFHHMYSITLWADLFALIWIVTNINVMNFLDGLDGLAAGTSCIAFVVIAIISFTPAVNQPLSGYLALIGAGTSMGFLFLNINPAKLFMGDSGSQVLGFLLGSIAIISGAKIATALLVFGLPIFDTFWVIGFRLTHGKKPWVAGRDHLHHKLLDLGYSQREIVFGYWGITMLFGITALLSSTQMKLYVLTAIVLGLIQVVGSIERKIKYKKD